PDLPRCPVLHAPTRRRLRRRCLYHSPPSSRRPRCPCCSRRYFRMSRLPAWPQRRGTRSSRLSYSSPRSRSDHRRDSHARQHEALLTPKRSPVQTLQPHPESRFQLVPMRMPVANTRAPPNATWKAAEIGGESMYFQRTQVITASSTTTTAIASEVAVQNAGMRKGKVWPIPPAVVINPQIPPLIHGAPRPVRLP